MDKVKIIWPYLYNYMPKKPYFLLLFLLLPFVTHAQEATDPNFNPGNIITAEQILNTDDLSLAEIQSFLTKKNSYLANYYTVNSYGTLNKSAAQIIYDAANNNYDCTGITLSDTPTEAERQLKCRAVQTVNPKFLLVLLQKEQSLISDNSPTDKQLDWATGYGCPDSWVCNPYYRGFGKQINSAALQFRSYIDEPDHYGFQAGQTYIAKDKYGILKSPTKAIGDGDYNTIVNSPEMVRVTIENQATAALYIYTPHIFNGNYNFYKLWNTYFPENPKLYPNGTVLQSASSSQVYLIQDNLKRPFLNRTSLLSRFSEKQIITVKDNILDAYDLGDPIKYPNYSLVKTPDKKIYLLVDNTKRLIKDTATFKKIGFNTEEIVSGTILDMSYYATGTTITVASTYTTGALLQNIKTGGVYYVQDNKKAPIIDKIFLSTKFKGRKITKVSVTELNKYQTIDPIVFDSGTLIKSSDLPSVYIIEDGIKRAFVDGNTFETLGYNWNNVITVSPQLLAKYPSGDNIILKQ